MIHVGTSGWNYPHWRERFYPRALPQSEWLRYYALHFDTVEVNNTFYRLPAAATVVRWREQVPPRFRFAVKASRFLTHQKRLLDAEAPLALFLERARHLEHELGPVLFQLPPNFARNDERLAQFLALLPKGLPCAFEFRHPSWHTGAVFDLLRQHRAAYCIMDAPSLPRHLVATAPLLYVRLHTPGAQFDHLYPEHQLRAWAHRLDELCAGVRSAWVYFNNDVNGHAVENARRLIELLPPSLPPPSAFVEAP